MYFPCNLFLASNKTNNYNQLSLYDNDTDYTTKLGGQAPKPVHLMLQKQETKFYFNQDSQLHIK